MLTPVLFLLGCLAHPFGYDYGRASWYGRESAKHRMADGDRFNPRALTAASFAYPLGTRIEVTNLANGRRIVVTVTDRGPAPRLNRLLDLSETAATRLGAHSAGVIEVAVMVRRFNS